MRSSLFDGEMSRDLDRIRRLGQISTATAYDVLEVAGFAGRALETAFRPLSHGTRLAGPAVTARGRSVDRALDEFPLSYALFRALHAGSVLVLGSEGHDTAALWGENVAVSARVSGCAGAVIDGGVRDIAALRKLNFPVFARYVTPTRAHGRFAVESVGEAVELASQAGGTIRVEMGDYVLADDDGVVVVPRERLDLVIEAAEHVERTEREIRLALEAGEDREVVDARFDKWAILRRRGALAGPGPQ